MLSPQKAADLAGVSRKTILDHIKSQKLHAIRNNRNHWQISEEDFEVWLKTRPKNKSSEPSEEVTLEEPSDSIELAVTRKELEILKNQISEKTQLAEHLEAKVEDLRTELNAERQRAADERKQLINALTEAQRPRSLREWILGKKP